MTEEKEEKNHNKTEATRIFRVSTVFSIQLIVNGGKLLAFLFDCEHYVNDTMLMNQFLSVFNAAGFFFSRHIF